MTRILALFVSLTLCLAVSSQTSAADSDVEYKNRLEIATRLVRGAAPPQPIVSMHSVMKYATEESIQKEIDKAYPSLSPLAKVRVSNAWAEVMNKHFVMFEKIAALVSEALAKSIASKYSLKDLQKISEQSQGKSFEDLNLLTGDEVTNVTATQVSALKPDLERFVNDFLAMNQRLIQQGLLPK